MNSEAKARAELLGSLLLFTRVFYKLRTGRDFNLSQPVGRESHYLTISQALTKTQRGNSSHLIINCPPRYGKSELCIHYVAWCLARYPDSNFLYVSYSHSLAKKQTQTIKQIVTLPEYKEYFGVEISDETRAKDNFETTRGGSVYAAGAAGTITGRGAGIQGVDRFGGAIVIDDIHKPDEVYSDSMRRSVNEWYLNTLQSRVNSPQAPIIFIGQRLHEDDLAANLINGFSGHEFDKVIIPAIDAAGNALLPSMHSLEQLKVMQEKMVYEFASQYQQDPQPAGGAIFRPEWFIKLEDEPKILATFITADTAETDKTYNDATVFSFWGLYKLEGQDYETDIYCLHWIDCLEDWIEPKDLQSRFLHFYSECMRHSVKPKFVAIEKKSTGTTLLSSLKDVRGLTVMDIERNRSSGNKTTRFLEVQPYVATKQISVPLFAKHSEKVIEHCRKITANDSHRYDDIADTLADAIRIALIDKIVINMVTANTKVNTNIAKMANTFKHEQNLRKNLWRR